MSFQWPVMLLALVLVAGVFGLYLRLVRSRSRRAAELAAQGLVPTASAIRMRRRRHVPFALFLGALTLLVLGLARPQMNLSLPRREGTVILAFDVSNSMAADDLKPNRMEAAKVAARAFVKKQPKSIKVGLVAFSDGGLVTQQPTFVQDDVLAALERLRPLGGTSLGQGMLASLNAINGKPIDLGKGPLKDNLDTIQVGFFGNASIVLLSDGENKSGIDPLAMAELASVAGVHIHTIGIGSTEGAVVKIDGFSIASSLDEAMLQDIAKTSDGTYSLAEDEAALAKVYDSIDLKFTRVGRPTEVTGLLAALGGLLMIVGAGLSLAWFGRVI
jgi:Ca-activated chloride channel homolog